MDRNIKVRLDQGETKIVKTRRGGKQWFSLSLIPFNLYSEYLTKGAFERFEDFKLGGQVIRTVKHADDLVLLAKEEMVLQGMIYRLIGIGNAMAWECMWKKN
jgi:hypothetical protein